MTFNSVAWAAAVVALAIADAGLVAFAAAFLGVSFVSSLVRARLAWRLARPVLEGWREIAPQLLGIGLTVGLAGLLTLAYARIDQILVFQLAGSRDAGLYGADYRVLNSAAYLPGAVMTTLFPIISAALESDRPRVRRMVQLAADYMTMASLPAFAFAAVAAEPILHVLFGSDFEGGAAALAILMAAFVVICFGYIAGNLVIVLRLQGLLIRYALIGLVLNVAVNLVLIPRYGFVAAAWVTLATELVVNGLALRAVLARLEMRLRVGRMLRVAGAAAAMAGAVAAARAAGAPLAVLAAAAVAVYGGLLLASRALTVAEARAFLARRPA
jgi:O-antigen/teichoic acid export membrane protein